MIKTGVLLEFGIWIVFTAKPLYQCKQEADSFKISANMTYICSKKFETSYVNFLCGSIAKNCSKALNEKKSGAKKLKYFRKL